MFLKNLKQINFSILPEKRSQAEIITARILKRDRAFVLAHPEFKPNFWQQIKIFWTLKKLKQNLPLAYILKEKEFFNLKFLVNEYVLIPRPETEILVEEAISQIHRLAPHQQQLLIDVGTGSGCIPIAILKNAKKIEEKNIQTIATDNSRKALRIAKKNAKQHKIKINFLQGDLLEPISKQAQQLFKKTASVIITANLPYITKEWFENEPSIQKEPQTALVADDKDGLSLYEKLFKQIQQLTPNVSCFISVLIEIDPRQSNKASTLTKKYFPQAKTEIQKDRSGWDRVLTIRLQ